MPGLWTTVPRIHGVRMTSTITPIGSQLATVETLDDRREIAHLLSRISPVRRVQFLRWCASLATLPGTSAGHPIVRGYVGKVADANRCERGDDRLTTCVYLDLLSMANQYRFDIGKAVLVLEKWAKTT